MGILWARKRAETLSHYERFTGPPERERLRGPRFHFCREANLLRMQIIDRDTETTERPAPPTAPTTSTATIGTFAELSLSEPVARALDEMGYDVPTEIQSAAIPVLMTGRDVMG